MVLDGFRSFQVVRRFGRYIDFVIKKVQFSRGVP